MHKGFENPDTIYFLFGGIMVYFNYAGIGPCRKEAISEVRRVLKDFEGLLFSEFGFRWYLRKLDGCRSIVDRFLNGKDYYNMEFVTNASLAINILLSSMVFEEGDVIVTSDQEHPSIVKPLEFLASKGIQICTVDCASAEGFISRLEDICQSNKRVKLVIISHVSYKDGRILPIKKAIKIAGEHKILIAIDGTQAVGQINVNLQETAADCYFFSGHKWCFGPMGTGVIAFSKNFVNGHKSLWSDFREKKCGGNKPVKVFEIGTQNIGLIAGLAKALEVKEAKSELAEMELLGQWRSTIKDWLLEENATIEIIGWEDEHAPCILTFRIKGVDQNKIVNFLDEKYSIVVKPINPPETPTSIRLSWSNFTKKSDFNELHTKLMEAFRMLG